MDRRFPVIPFDAPLFAPFFGARVGDLDVRLLPGGACNSNYLVRESGGTQWVCRIHSRGNPQMEHYVTSLVRNTKNTGNAQNTRHPQYLKEVIPTPEYVWIGDGVSVMSFIEGVPLLSTPGAMPAPPIIREAGRIIGRLATIRFPQAGQIFPDGTIRTFECWPPFLDGISSLMEHPGVRDFLEDSDIRALTSLLVLTRDVWSEFDTWHSLVHGDFNPGNVLVSGDRITGILDWEFAHSGCSYMDIGNLLRHLPPDAEPFLAQGLADEGFPLPDTQATGPTWQTRAHLINLASHLKFLTSAKSHEFKLTRVDLIHMLLCSSTCS